MRSSGRPTDRARPAVAPGPARTATFRETDVPGIYGVTLVGQDQTTDRRMYALNVPAEEGLLEVLEDQTLLKELGPQTSVQIRSAASFDWIRSESPGAEIRWFLLVALAVVCIAEQFLSARLSYQPGQ